MHVFAGWRTFFEGLGKSVRREPCHFEEMSLVWTMSNAWKISGEVYSFSRMARKTEPASPSLFWWQDSTWSSTRKRYLPSRRIGIIVEASFRSAEEYELALEIIIERNGLNVLDYYREVFDIALSPIKRAVQFNRIYIAQYVRQFSFHSSTRSYIH